ncbi:MAG: MFS transporter [Ferruginibacter sp.]|nr:MFS transporter [Ferruginibacter sp.]
MFKNIASFIKLKPALAVGFLFSTSSLLFGTWVASIPVIKERMGFSDGSLGLSLLLSPLGAITGMLLSTRIFSKIQVGKWMVGGSLTMCAIMVLQVNSVNRPMLWTCLYLFGVFGFLNGVSSNATVTLLEKKYNRLFMSTCHGMYSLGGAVSAGVAGFLFMAGIPSGWQIVLVASAIVTVIFFNRLLLLANKNLIHSRSGIKIPSLSVLGISFICLISFMAEGCVADWSAIYLKETLHSPKTMISLGYAGFSIAMTIGRLNGDSLISGIGSKKVGIGGCLLAALGFLIVVLAPILAVAIIGYVLVGFGCCCSVPVLFSAAANIPGLSTVEGFAMVTTGGLIGFLAGPSLIGFIAEKANLSVGLSLLVILSLLSAFVAWRNQFLTSKGRVGHGLSFDEQIY